MYAQVENTMYAVLFAKIVSSQPCKKYRTERGKSHSHCSVILKVTESHSLVIVTFLKWISHMRWESANFLAGAPVQDQLTNHITILVSIYSYTIYLVSPAKLLFAPAKLLFQCSELFVKDVLFQKEPLEYAQQKVGNFQKAYNVCFLKYALCPSSLLFALWGQPILAVSWEGDPACPSVL